MYNKILLKPFLAIALMLFHYFSPAQIIKVTLLGTGSLIPAIDRFGPSTLVEAGGQKFLFDCGRGAGMRLWQLEIPLGRVVFNK